MRTANRGTLQKSQRVFAAYNWIFQVEDRYLTVRCAGMQASASKGPFSAASTEKLQVVEGSSAARRDLSVHATYFLSTFLKFVCFSKKSKPGPRDGRRSGVPRLLAMLTKKYACELRSTLQMRMLNNLSNLTKIRIRNSIDH